MVQNIVERVARAIEDADGHEPDEEVFTPDGFVKRWKLAVPAARAAILEALQAMREPSEGMINAAFDLHAQRGPLIVPFGPEGSFAQEWRAMIDAAIKEMEEAG